MTIYLPYMAGRLIERNATALLNRYAQVCGIRLEPPIPVENIVEKHLKLSLEFDDTHKLFRVPRSGREPDILGAIFLDDGRIVIDESLDPVENPAKEGRFRFTLAHEGGHYRLHRDLLAKRAAQAESFGSPAAPPVVCRSSQAKERVEQQADLYASCLLMPRHLVAAACGIGKVHFAESDYDAHEFARPLAEVFLVSPTAMRIRLEQLGLLIRSVSHRPIAGCE